MKDLRRRSLALLLSALRTPLQGLIGTVLLVAAVPCVATSCVVTHKLGITHPGFRLAIEQDQNLRGELLSLYIIVSDQKVIAEPLGGGDAADLLDDELIGKYRSFRQYVPLEDRTWRLESEGNSDPRNVAYEEEGAEIQLVIDHDLVAGAVGARYSLVIVGQYAGEFEVREVDEVTLASKDKQRMRVGPARLALEVDS